MPKKVEPKFTLAQAQAVRVAISYGEESEDGRFRKILENARRELDRAELTTRRPRDP